MNIDPKSLKLFVRVIELGAIAAAAKQEHIAVAAVSKRISDLERSVGAKLISRNHRGVTATPAGLAVLDFSRRILNDLRAFGTQMQEFAHGLQGRVRIAANISAITQFLPRQLSAFLATNPSLCIHLEERLSAEIGRSVVENAADLGILVLGARTEGLEYHPYQEDQLMLAVPANHQLTAYSTVTYEQTLDYAYVGLGSGSQLNLQLIQAATALGRAWVCRIQVTSYDALCLMIEAGLGIGVLPARLALSYAKALQLTPIELRESWARRTFAICCRPRTDLPSSARLLLDHLLQNSHLDHPTVSGQSSQTAIAAPRIAALRGP